MAMHQQHTYQATHATHHTHKRFLTGAIEAVSEKSGLSQEFLGLIVLPIAGNACEHITAVFVAMKNKCDLALGVALGSSIQVRGKKRGVITPTYPPTHIPTPCATDRHLCAPCRRPHWLAAHGRSPHDASL